MTDTVLRSAKPKSKPYKKFDSGGLYIEIAPPGGGGGDSDFASVARTKDSRSAFTQR
jgi:hypothetical protein